MFCEIIGYPKEQILKRIEIYEGGTRQLMEIVHEIDDRFETIMIFGHNPTITQFSNLLAGNHIDNMVTCGVVRIDMEIKSWKDTASDTGQLVWYEFPKKHH